MGSTDSPPDQSIAGETMADRSMAGKTLSHYRLLEQIGAGAMGIVFRAHDQTLERDVAIKILKEGMLAQKGARRRFRHEALALARLNHPNIAAVYEFGSEADEDFIVMELIPGTSLADRLAAGPLSQKEILRYGLQLAHGLSAAHERGVIHRDLKPGNVHIHADGGLKILDFGLVQFQWLEGQAAITGSVAGGAVGTLPYMAPEQLRGEETGVQSDIWSAGAVLYQMATGQRPFPQENAPLLIDAILNKPPRPPRSVNPDLTHDLEALILRALEKKPECRYQSCEELRVALDALTQIPGGSATSPAGSQVEQASRLGVNPRRAILAGAAVFALAGLVWLVNFRPHTPAHSPGTAGVRRAAAVLGFKNLTQRPEAAWLSNALDQMFTTELAAGENIRLVPGEQVARMKADLAIPDADALTRETLGSIARDLRVDLVVLGSYVALDNGNIRLDLRLQDTATGETLLLDAVAGDEKDLLSLVRKAGEHLREKCGAGKLTEQDESGVKASFPARSEAVRLYAEGLAKLRVFDALTARDLLRKAVAADPNYALAHSALAAAWSALGYDEPARQSSKNAFALSAELSREDRFLVEARYREMNGEWDAASGVYRTLFGFFPDNLEYGVLLARSQTEGGKGREALATVESLRQPGAPWQDDARIELAGADAAGSVGDFKQAAAFAEAAARKARSQGAKLLLARALYTRGLALENLREAPEAISAIEQAERIYTNAGDANGTASALEVMGNVLADQGDLEAALAKYRQERALVRKVGNKRAEASALNNMALVLNQQGDRDRARLLWDQAVATFREIGDKSNTAMALINIGGVLKEQGDLTGAETTYEQTLAISREVNDRNGIALSLSALGTVLDSRGDFPAARRALQQALDIDLENRSKKPAGDKLVDLADVMRHAGDLAGARKVYQDALAISEGNGDKSMSAYALFGLGKIALQGADFAEAHKDYDRAMALRAELGERHTIAETRVALTELAMEEGNASGLEIPLQEARSVFRRNRNGDDEIIVTTLLARCRFAQGDTRAAKQELESAGAAALKTQNLDARLDYAITKARLRGAAGLSREAKPALRAALADAKRTSFLAYQFEARLALAEMERRSTERDAALEALEREANAQGFHLVARKAARLRLRK